MSVTYLWDYDLNEEQFTKILSGKLTIGRLDQDWAAIRLLEYASYMDIVRLIGFKRLINGWPRWREKIRSVNRKRSFDWFVDWLPEHHQEWI